ncbi:fimbrillin family protein [uncultured Muribaculum sp.]|uniref:fimbrillin family protein n=1 Tax=uncultured Muribaculum sp. TaxID=1918613 RepID=UPI0025CE4DB4|nr:fimbrillin family protein [uncultured Muribaculum sp.]
MKPFCYRSLSTLVCRGIAIAATIAVTTSCDDTPLPGSRQHVSTHPVFDVEILSGWKNGMIPKRSSEPDIDIERIGQTDKDGKPLYLVTERLAINDSSAVSKPIISRGTSYSGTNMPESFGLSAICYPSGDTDTDLSDMTANFANNVMVKPGGGAAGEWSPVEQLDWVGSGRLRFMGYAPYATGDNGIIHSSPGETGAPWIDFTVNPVASKQVDLLRARADCAGTGTPSVKMGFEHALAAVTIKTGSAMLAGNVTSVTLSGVALAGRLSLDTGVWTPVQFSEDDEVTVDLPKKPSGSDQGVNLPGKEDETRPAYTENGTNIAGGNGDGLTLFMIPQTLGDEASLSITFTDQLSGLTHSLTASIGGNDKKWESGNMYSYSLSSTGVVVAPVVEIEGLPATDATIPYTGVISNLKYKAYVTVYSSEEEKKVIDIPHTIKWGTSPDAMTNTGKWVSDVPQTNDGDPTQPEEGYIVLGAQDVFANVMRLSDTSTKRGTRGAPLDLTSADNPRAYKPGETANCYIIDRPGYYKLPVVYGNAWSNGADNKPSYTGNSKGLKYFADHRNQPINTYNIREQIKNYGCTLKDAFLLWQDSPGLVDKIELISVAGAAPDSIRFRVRPETLAQGNSVIALRDSNGDIVWSWHIWATDFDWSKSKTLTTVSAKAGDMINDKEKVEGEAGAGGKEYSFPPSTLGYCKSHTGVSPRTIYMKIEFDLHEADGSKFSVDEVGENTMRFVQDKIVASLAGDNTYYMYGRKDPMQPGVYDKADNYYYHYKYEGQNHQIIINDKTYTSPSNSNGEFTMLNKPLFDSPGGYEFTRTPDDDGLSIGATIRHPNWFHLGRSDTSDLRNHWHSLTGNKEPYTASYIDDENLFCNIWNAKALEAGSQYKVSLSNEIEVAKTIYDPSPAGFHVPHANAFSGMVPPKSSGSPYTTNPIKWNPTSRCWTFSGQNNGNGDQLTLYATGLRDMIVNSTNIHFLPEELEGTTWSAFSMITFIASSTLFKGSAGYQLLIFGIDNRRSATQFDKISCRSCWGSNDSYGLTVWPVAEK